MQSQGQKKDNQKDNQNFSRTNPAPLRTDSGDVLPVKKTEKVLTAIYLVSNHFEDKPLKDKVRESALELVSVMRCLNCRIDDNAVKDAVRLAEEIDACFNLAATVGLVSPMNGEVISRVVNDLLSSLRQILGQIEISSANIDIVSLINAAEDTEQKEAQKTKKLALGAASFSKAGAVSKKEKREPAKKTLAEKPATKERLKEKPAAKSEQKKAAPNQPSLKPIPNTKNGKEENKNGAPEFIEGEPSPFFLKDIKDKDKEQTGNRLFDPKERRDTIIDIAQELREFSINDVSTKLPELGEKTIQRELASLVEAGILRKMGEKRWVKYIF